MEIYIKREREQDIPDFLLNNITREGTTITRINFTQKMINLKTTKITTTQPIEG
jgi:hypothetical protein